MTIPANIVQPLQTLQPSTSLSRRDSTSSDTDITVNNIRQDNENVDHFNIPSTLPPGVYSVTADNLPSTDIYHNTGNEGYRNNRNTDSNRNQRSKTRKRGVKKPIIQLGRKNTLIGHCSLIQQSGSHLPKLELSGACLHIYRGGLICSGLTAVNYICNKNALILGGLIGSLAVHLRSARNNSEPSVEINSNDITKILEIGQKDSYIGHWKADMHKDNYFPTIETSGMLDTIYQGGLLCVSLVGLYEASKYLTWHRKTFSLLCVGAYFGVQTLPKPLKNYALDGVKSFSESSEINIKNYHVKGRNAVLLMISPLAALCIYGAIKIVSAAR